MGSVVLVAVLLAVTATSAGLAVPTTRDTLKCAGYCKEGSKFKYEVGSTYTYVYNADTVTSVSGAGDENSRLHLSASVEIHAVSPCDFTMQLHGVKLEDSEQGEVPRSSEFSSALERNALLFSFQDGTVDELCATSTDPPWVLNIKRGVLSAFQNSMNDLHTGHKLFETDVTGVCETEYSVQSTNDAFSVVSKKKNLLACDHRLDHFLSLQSTPYSSESHARSLPLVKSDHECLQTYESGLLIHATCSESHLFRPFSNGDNGAVTKVVQNLQYKHHLAGKAPTARGGATIRTTLLFQHTADETTAETRAHTIVNTLEELERMTRNGVQRDTPQVFSQLVATLKSTSYPTLAKVFSRTRQQHTRKFLLDAMPLVGTADGLTVMTDLYKSGEISDAEMDSWLTSLTFLKRPTITMLLAISSLLDGEPRPKAVLGLSSLVHSYCQMDSDCHEKEPVQDYLSKMEKLLGDGCHIKGRKDMELKILALKGIGNMGLLPTSLNTISKCYLNPENPLEIRLAAIGAHRRLPCSSTWTTNLLQTYTNMQLDTELRIAAYLTVMQCPSAVILGKVKETLYSEEVNQVASFVWTHLTNIQETSSRWKQSIKDLITSDFLQNKFHTDARKFSRNYEGSLFADSLNAGVTVDSNIVFTPQSYLPRSASLNLTLDLFGESINVFEVGSRAEGFEMIVEDMFGPRGYFPDKSLRKVLQNARARRDDDLENSIDQLAEAFDANGKLNAEPQASTYARVFGNEIHYSRYQGLAELSGGHPNLDNPLEAMSKLLGGRDVDYAGSFVFLDASYRFPTAAGLSLELAVNGSATVGLKTSGHLHLSLGSMEVRGKVAPSASVRVSGTMAVDCVVARAGLRSVSVMHTNTYLEGRATVRGHSLVDLQVEMPREKVELLEVTSTLFVLRREVDVEVAGILQDREASSGCSSDVLSRIAGVKLCGELAYPNASLDQAAPSFPLNGPAALRLNLFKTDTFDSYVFNFQQLSQADGDVHTLKLQFDTPNSKIDRKIMTFLSLDKKNAAVKGNLQTPFVKLDVNGKLDYNENSKAIDLTVHMNDVTVFATKSAVKTSHKGQLRRYEPTLSMVIHNVVDLGLTGKVNYIEGTKYSADFTLSGLTNTPLLLAADLNCDGSKYDMIGSIQSPLVEGTVHANLRQTNSYVNTKVTVEYSVQQSKTESINLSGKIQSSYKKALQKNSVYGSLQMSALPQYNLLVRWDRMSGDNYAEYNGRFGLGKTEWQTKQLYRLQARGSDDINFSVLCHLACPSKDVDYKAEVQYKTTESSISTHALAQLSQNHKFYSALNFQSLDERQEFAAEFSSPWYMTSLKGEVVEREPGHFATKMEGRYEVMGPRGVSSVQSLAMQSTYIDTGSETRQEQKLSIELSGVWAASLSGELISETGSSNMWVQLDVQGKKYKADVTHAQNGVSNHIIHTTVLLVDRTYHSKVVLLHTDIETAFSIDLQLSKRLALSTKTFNDGITQGVEFELLWDKDADPTKRISMMVHKNNVKREALLEFPGQYVKAELVTLPKRVSALLEWAEDQKIAINVEWNIEQDGANGTARLTTPFPGIESQSMSANYKYNAMVIQIETDLAWRDETITLAVTGINKNTKQDVGDQLAVATKYEVRTKITSTIKSIADISANYEHQIFMQTHSKSLSIFSNKKTVFSSSMSSQPSELKADVYFDSPFKLLPSIHGNVSRINTASEGHKHSLQLHIGLDKKLVTEFVIKQDSGTTGLVQVITPYVGFKNTTASFAYSNEGSELNLIVGIEHDKKLTSISVLGSKTTEIMLGSCSLITPFTKPFEAGFTHSLKLGVLKEGISLSSGGQHMFLGSLVGILHSLSDFKLTADVTLPSHSLITKLENQVVATSIKTEFEGLWNGDRLAGSLLVSNCELQLIAIASDLRAKKEVHFVFSHTREPGAYYFTNLKLHDYLIFSHKLSIEDVANWENTIYTKLSSNEGQITNKQSYKASGLDFAHSMDVDWNGPQATFKVAFMLDDRWFLPIVKTAEGGLTTSWTQPIAFVFNLPVTKTSVNPQLIVKYQNNKEVTIESMVQFESMTVTGKLDVKSPYCKPIHLNALYDVSLPTKVALLTIQWEDKQVDFKSTVHVGTMRATGVVLLKRSDMDGEYINAQFMYDTLRKENMTGHLTVGYKGTKMDVDLSGSLTNDIWKGNCEIITPFSTWEKLTTSFNVDMSKPTKVSVLTMGRNNESVSLSASAHLSSPWLFSSAFNSTMPSVPSVSLSASLEASQAHNALKLSCDYGGRQAQLLATLETGSDLGVIELSIQTPFKDAENLLGRASYVGKPGDKSLGIIVKKNQLKIQVDANCLCKQNATGEVSVMFQSPFEGLERLSGSLKHTLKTKPDRQITTDIVLTRNNERVEMVSSVATSLDGLTVNVQCKTPINEYKIIVGDFSIKHTPVQKSIQVSLVKNEERVDASAVLKMTGQWNAEASLQVTTPFQGYEELSAGFYYGLQNSVLDEKVVDGKAKIFLDVSDDTSEIEINLNYFPSSYKSNIKATFKLPILSISNINIEGKFDMKQKLLDLQGKVDEQFMSLHAELFQNSLDTSILSSINGYERLNFSSVFTLTTEKKVAQVLFAKNDAEFVVSITAILDYLAPELHIASTTPIDNWQKLNIDAKYDVSKPKKTAQFTLTKVEDQYTIEANWSGKEDGTTEYTVILNSPIDGFKTVKGSVDYSLAHKFSANALLQTDVHKIEGAIVASDGEIRVFLNTPLEQIKHLALVGSYDSDGKAKSIVVRMEINEEETQFDVKLVTTSDTTSIAINTPFSSCRTFLLMLTHAAENKALVLAMFKNSVKLVEISGQVDIDLKSRIGFNVNASLPIISSEKLSLEAWYTSQLPQRKVIFHLYINDATVAELQSTISLAQEDGLDYVMKVDGGLFDYNRHALEFEFHLKDNSVKSGFSLTNEDTEDRYYAQLVFDNTTLKISLSSPMEGYEDFLLQVKRSAGWLAVDLNTSFFYYDTLKLSGQISSNKNFENFVSFSLAKAQERFDVDWKLQYDTLYAKSSFVLASPFSGYESLNLKGEYDFGNQLKSLTFALDRNDHSIKIDSMLSLKGKLLAESSINVTTSCPDFRNIKLFAVLDMNRPSHRSVFFSGHLNDAHQVGLTFDLESGNNKAKLALVSITPYYETSFGAKASYDFSDPSKVLSLEGVVSALDIVVNVSAVLDDHSKRGEVHATFSKAKIQREGKLSWGLENEKKQKKAIVTVDFGGTKKVELVASVLMDGFNNIKSHVNVTDFVLHRYAITADWSVVKEKIESKLGFQWNNKGMFLQSLVDYKDSNRSTNFKFTSPYSNFEEIIFQSKWTHGNSYEFATLLQWKKDKKVVLNVVHPGSQLQAKLETPYTSPISFSLQHLSTNSSLDFHSNVLASFNYGPWSNELNATYEVGEHVNVGLTLTTPINGVKFLQFNGKFKSDVNEGEALLSLELEDQKWKFSGNAHKYEHKADIGIQLTTPLQSLKQGQLLASYDISNGYSALLLVQQNEDTLINGTVRLLPSSAMFEVRTPWQGLHLLSAECRFDIQRAFSQLVARSNYEGKKSEFEANINVESDKILAEVHLKSPWSKDFSLHGLYNKVDTHTMKMTLRRGEQVTEMLGYLGYVAEDLKLEVEFESAVEGYGSLSAKGGYNWQNPLKTAQLSARVGETEFHARAQGKLSKDGIMGDLHIDTPVDSLKLLEIKVQLEKTGSIVILIEDKKYQLQYTTTFSGGSISGQVSLSSPKYQLKNAAFVVKYGKNFLNFNGEINEKKVDFDSSFQFDRFKFFLNSKLQAPVVNSLKHIELKFDLDMLKSVFSSCIQWTPTEKINIESKLGEKDFRLSIDTPFDNLRSMDVSSQMVIKKNVYDVVSRVDWDALKIDFDGSVQMEPLDASCDLQAEWGNSQTATMRAALASKEDKISVHTIGTVQGKQINIVAEIDKANLIAKLNVEIPFFEIVPMYAEARLTKDLWKTCDADIRVSLPTVSYKATANFALTDGDVKVGLDLDLPFITSSLVMGGSYSNDNFTEMETMIYINNNKVSASYEIVNKVLTGALDVNVPDLDISVKRIDVQTSLAFNPDIQASLTYRSASYNGSIAGSMLKLKDGLSLRTDLDFPQSLGPLTHTARMGVKYLGSQQFVEVRLDNGRSTRSASLEINMNGLDTNIVGRISGPSIGDKEVTVAVQNNLQLVSVNIFNVLHIEMKNDITSGSAAVQYAGKEHKVLYQVSRNSNQFDANLALESVLLKTGNIKLYISSEIKENNVQAVVKCDVGKFINAAVMEFVNEPTKKSISLEITRASQTVVKLSVTKQLKENIMENEASCEWFNTLHAASLKYNPARPINVQLMLSSPRLPHNLVEAKLSMQDSSIMAYAGIGNKILNHYIAFNAGLNFDEKSASFEFQAPCLSLVKSLTLNGVFKVSKQNIHLSFDGNFSSELVSDSQLLTRFVLSKNGIDASVIVHTPFLEFRYFETTVQIPFIFNTKQYNLNLLVSLPNGIKYAAHALMHNSNGTYELSASAEYNAQKIGGYLKLLQNPEMALDFKLDTPFKTFKHYQVQLRGQRSLVDGDDIINYVEWNEQRIELRHSTVSTEKKFDYRVQLTTPFKSYERYVVGLQLEFDVHKKALAVLSFPGLETDWAIEFDFHLKDLTDSRFLVNIQMPIFSGFKTASLLVGSKYDAEKVSYRGVVSANYNKYEFITTLDGILEGIGLKLDFNTQLDNNKVNAQFIGGFQDNGMIFGGFEIETPFSQLKSGKVSLQMFPYELRGLQANINLNSVEIVYINVFEDKQYKKTIEVRSPWRSVSVAYSLTLGYVYNVWGEVCWDLNNKTTSQFGVGFLKSYERTSLSVHLPTRDMSLNYTSPYYSSSVLEYATALSWEAGQILGYRVRLERDSTLKRSALVRLDLPFRAFELSSHVDPLTSSNGGLGAQFMWNAALDRSKRMEMALTWTPHNAELSLNHAALKHSLALRIEQENCLISNPELPRTVKLALQYTPLPQDLLTLGVFYQGAWEDKSGAEMFFSVRHDASNLDHSVLLSALQTSEHSSAKLGVNYKAYSTGKKHTLEIYAKKRNNHPDIEVSIQDTNNKMAVRGSIWSKDNGYQGFTAQVSMNQKEPLIIEGQINWQEVSSELDVHYGANRGYTLSAGMPTPRLISAGITHKLYGLPSTDAQITLKLNTSRLLWTQVRWQSGMLDKMQLSLFREYTDISLVAQSIVNSFSEMFDEDLLERLVTVCSAVCADSFVDVGAYVQEEMKLIGDDFRDAMKVATSMYERNDFYIRDIQQSLSGAISYVHETGACVLKRAMEITEELYSAGEQLFGLILETFYTDLSQVKDFFKDVQELLLNVSRHMVEVVSDLRQLSESLRTTAKDLLTALREGIAQADRMVKGMLFKAKDYVADMTSKGSNSLRPYLVEVQRYTIFLHNSLIAIEHSILEMAQTVVETIMAVKELEELAKLYDEYSGWLEELQVHEYLDRVLQYLNVVGEILVEDFNRMFAEYKESIDIALSVMSGQVEKFDRVPAVAYVKHVIDTVSEKVLWLWRYHNMSAHLELYFESILNNADEIVAQLMHSVDMDPQPRSHSRRQLVVRPGYLEISQRLPVEWKSFQTWPEFSQFTAPSSSEITGLDGYNTYITAALSKLSPSFSEALLLPPFGATGIIAGKQHFITFDNYFYDFVGECSYLLASDFLDNKFSIVINYELTDNNVVKKSLTIISEDHHIDISANYQITVDGKRVELPAVIGNDIVMSRFGNRLIVESEYNMAVECNLVHDICTVQLTGWNFGKTGGLLGTFDNEPFNDLSFPNGTSTSDLARFASSWRVGNSSRCRPVNHANTPPANDDAIDACDPYFTDIDSPLSACYASIDPMPYYHMCISDVARVGDSGGMCSAAIAYATQCRKAGLDATLPHECVRCHLPNSPALSVGESKLLNGGVPSSADIVFVVEQGACIKDVNLAKLTTKLDAALVQQGLVDNRFSVVGFGGETFPQPHSRTAKGEIWTSGRGMEKAFAGLVLSNGEYSRTEQDVYDALTFASDLSFRGGVSKTVVLVQCSACDVQLDYGNMMGLLLQNDITLHLLEPGAVALRDSSLRTNSKVFGADLSGVYTARNGKHVKPNVSLLKQMILPKDHCSPLAFETNGTVFNLERLSSPSKQVVSLKKFADVWSRRVAQAARPSPCQKCECVASEDGVGYIQCSTCVAASVDQFLLDWQSLLTEDYNQPGVATAEKSDEDDS